MTFPICQQRREMPGAPGFSRPQPAGRGWPAESAGWIWSLAGFVVLLLLLSPASAQTLIEQRFTNLNLTIPDNNPSGVVSLQTITGSPPNSVILDVNVSLKLTGSTARNGDLYATLNHQSGYAILLNRVGRTTNNVAGYEDSGLDLVLDDEAVNGDVHLYRATLFFNPDVPLRAPLASNWAGAWASDGRNVDPAEATDQTPRDATLSSFKGLPVDGNWRLFVADVTPGGVSQLAEWSLQIVSTTNLNDVKLSFENATFRADSDARRLDTPITVKGRVTVAGAADLALAGNVDGSGTLTKTGAGKLVLSGVNTFSGGIAIEEGTLVLEGDRSTGLGPIRLKGGRIEASGGSKRLDNAVSFAGKLSFGGGGLDFGGAVTLDSGADLSLETDTVISGDVAESSPGSGFIKSGTGKLTLSGVNTFSGGLALEEGTLVLGSDKAVGTGTLKLSSRTTIETSGGQRQLSNPVKLAGDIGFSGGLTVTGDVTLDALAGLEVSGTTKLSGTLKESSPDTGFVKKGIGTMILEGANTISGGVSLDEGTLLINNTSGSGTGSGDVSVQGKATLGGNGSIAGKVLLGRGTRLAPGASPGMLTTGAETWEGGSTFVWEINDGSGKEGTDPGWDTLKINGVLQLNATPAVPLVIQMTSLALNNAPGAAGHFDPAQDYVWKLVQTTDGVKGFNAGVVSLDTALFANSLNGGKLSLEVRGNDLVLVFTALRRARLTGVENLGALLRISVQGDANQSLRVEATDSLSAPNWVVLGTAQADATGRLVFDAPLAGSRPVQFYRVVSN